MNILFVHKNEFVEPLGIMSLSAYLKKRGHTCSFLDVDFEKDAEGEILKIAPDIIAYSIMTGRHKYYEALNRRLKKRFKFFAIFGGPHCTFFPEFIEEESVDAICRGEGEVAFAELADKLANGGDITKIDNIWVKIDGNIYKNELRDLISDLDTVPFPDRELINKYNHYKKIHRRSIMTGRGCPYHCTYCFNHSYNTLYKDKGKIVRKRTVDNVIGELISVKAEYSPRRFHFWDDTFNIDREWLLHFCDAYRSKVNIPFLANFRVDLVNEDGVKALKKAGLITAVTSIESGNEGIRNKVLKRNISESQITGACRLFHKYGMNLYIGNMVGLPDETLDMVFETLALNIKCKPSFSNCNIYMPYPRTDLCRYSKERGYYSGNVDSINERTYNTSAMDIKDIKKIERLHHLFSLGTAFPILVPVIRVLINVPLEKFYRLLWHIHRAWCYCFRVKYLDISELFVRE